MKDSRLVTDTKHCIFCGSDKVEEHHVFFGPDRSVADRYRLTVPLCREHHAGGINSPHRNRIMDLTLKCWAQAIYEKEIGSRDDFRREFRKSYL